MEWNSWFWGVCSGSLIWAVGMMFIFTKLRMVIDDVNKELSRLENERRELHKIIKSLSGKSQGGESGGNKNQSV